MDRTLRALGLDTVPFRHPLTYPGRPVPGPCLLTGRELLPLRVRAAALGTWQVPGDDRTVRLDQALTALGQAPVAERHPVIAVGSNASPAQVVHKLEGRSLPVAVPMVPVRVPGIAIGCSAHIGRAGYVAAAPYADPAAETGLVISWLDAAQLAAMDVTELHYRRVALSGDAFALTLPSGERLPGASVYVSHHGVLLDPATGRPRPGGGDQGTLLTALLRASPRLRALLGPDPADWTQRARAEEAVRAEGARIFVEEGWVRPPGDLPWPAAQTHGHSR